MNLTERTDRALTWIEKQLAICNAATAGKWVTPDDEPWNVWERQGSENGAHCVADCGPRRNHARGMTSSLANAAFIAAARTGYPAMLNGMKIAIEWAVFQDKHGNPGNGLLADLVTKIESLQ